MAARRVISRPGQEPEVIDLTPEEEAENAAVVAAPIRWGEEEIFRKRTVSVGTAPTEIYRIELLQLTGYSIDVTVIGVDRNNGAIKKLRGDYTLKRLSQGPLLVGETLNPPHQDTAAAAWALSRTFVTDTAGKHYGVISVVGAANRTIDWLVRGEMFRFSPQLTDPAVPDLEPPPPAPVSEAPPAIEPMPEIPPEETSEPHVPDFPIGEPE